MFVFSKEKIDILRVLGAEVTTVPVVAFTDPNNYNHHVFIRRRCYLLGRMMFVFYRQDVMLNNMKIQSGQINLIIELIDMVITLQQVLKFGPKQVNADNNNGIKC